MFAEMYIKTCKAMDEAIKKKEVKSSTSSENKKECCSGGKCPNCGTCKRCNKAETKEK